MPENIAVLIAMVVVLVSLCGIIGYWTLSSRTKMRENPRQDRRDERGVAADRS